MPFTGRQYYICLRPTSGDPICIAKGHFTSNEAFLAHVQPHLDDRVTILTANGSEVKSEIWKIVPANDVRMVRAK